MRILTFDIEDWFNVLNSVCNDDVKNWHKLESRLDMGVEYLIQLKEQLGFQATAFTVGWFAENHPKTILKLHRSGFEIACHTYAHRRLDISYPKLIKEEISRSVDILEDLLGEKVLGFRAPGFSMNLDNAPVILETMIENELTYSSSIFPGLRLVGGVNNFQLTSPFNWSFQGVKINELPISVTDGLIKGLGYSGGAYFRLLPKVYLKYKFQTNREYLMTYFHPRDFDYNQPKLKDLGVVQNFLSYYGLKSSRTKFEEMLRDSSWLNCVDYLKLIVEDDLEEFKL